MVIAVKQHNSLNIAKMKEIKGYLCNIWALLSGRVQRLVQEDDMFDFLSVDFFPEILFFSEVFKCINYYYVSALTVLLPKMKMVPKNGQAHLFHFSFWCWAETRQRTELWLTKSSHRVHQDKRFTWPLHKLITFWVLSQVTQSKEEKTRDPIRGGIIRIIRTSA